MRKTAETGKRAILAAALLALSGGAWAQFEVRKAPDFAPIMEKVCLPLLRGGSVEQAAANAKALAFAQTARNASMITLERDTTLSLTVGNGTCFVSMGMASLPHFPAVEGALRPWLPRLGRYWAGRIEADAFGVRHRRYRAGGFTITLDEQIDEYGRRLNLTMSH